MTIEVGQKLPEIDILLVADQGPKKISSHEFFAGKKTVLFALPGAFTPTCSAKHLPGFLEHANELSEKGVDQLACLSVNDVFVMAAWAKDQNVEGRIEMIADGSGDFTRAVGLEVDSSAFFMGKRSRRYAMIVNDNQVEHLFVDDPGSFEVSSAEHVLKAL